MTRPSMRSPLIALILMAGMVVTVNWPYQYTVVSTVPFGQIDSVVDFDRHPQKQMPIIGGWPLRYLVQYPSIHPDVRHRSFFVVALLGNIAVASVMIIAVMLYIIRRQRRISAGKLAKRGVNIADLLIATLLLAVPFAWWQRAGKVRESELALQRQIASAGGAAILDTWIPKVFASRVPHSLKQQLQRLRDVRLEEPTSELVAKLVDHGHLTTLRLGGDGYDLRLLDRLVTNPHVSDLRIAGRVIDARTLQAIAAHPHLDTLNLMRTNVTAESLALLDPLGELQRLSLIHSDVALKDLGTPGWSATIRELDLPHPSPGDADSLEIDGWSQLQMLRINELDTLRNPVPMVVVLKNLPSLKDLQLDNFQKFDLTFDNLPLLEKITDRSFEWRSRIPRGGTAPGQLWCSRFVASRMPKLREIKVFGLDLKEFEVRECPLCAMLGIGVFYRTVSAAQYAPKLDPVIAEQMILGIGNSEGPRQVDLDAVPLKGVDLAPLAQNKQLTELLLSFSGTNIKQWKPLESMKWLTRFDVKDCVIDEEGVQWVLNSFPNLQHFAFSTATEQSFFDGEALSLEIVDRENLRTIDFGETQMHFLNEVRVVNSPNLAIPLKLGYVQKLEVTDSPLITGFSLESPPPLDAKVSGFKDLQFLAVGGPSVTDQWIDAIADCPSLGTLTLAYPSVTAEGLMRLKVGPNLSSLFLPGTLVDDRVVAAWPEMDQLTSIDLSDTKITGEGLNRLIKSPYLDHLAINNTNVKATELAALKDKTQLTQLKLGGVGIDATTLAAVLKANPITRLDLSDSDVTPKTLDAIANHGSGVVHLALRNCELDNNRLMQIARRFPQLSFDLSGSTVSTELMTQLVSLSRMVESAELEQHLAMQQMMNSYSSNEYYEPQRPAIIDIATFAEIARQPLGQGSAGMPMVIAPGVIITAPAPFPPGPQPTTPQGSPATRLGRWLGGLVAGSSNDQVADNKAVDSAESENASGDEPNDEEPTEDDPSANVAEVEEAKKAEEPE